MYVCSSKKSAKRFCPKIFFHFLSKFWIIESGPWSQPATPPGLGRRVHLVAVVVIDKHIIIKNNIITIIIAIVVIMILLLTWQSFDLRFGFPGRALRIMCSLHMQLLP